MPVMASTGLVLAWVRMGNFRCRFSFFARGEKASYYSAVCLETGEVEWMELEGNSNRGTSVAFLTQLPDATEGKAYRAAAGHLGQCAGPPWGSGAGVPQDA